MKNLIPSLAFLLVAIFLATASQGCKNPPCQQDLFPVLKAKFNVDNKYKYCTDKMKYPYVMNNLLLEYDDTVPPSRIKALIDLLEPDSIDSCLCSPRVQNLKWNTDINVEEKVSQVSSQSKGEGNGDMRSSPNYFTYLSNNEPRRPIDPKDFVPKGGMTGTQNGKLIAILDTGFDPDYADGQRIKLSSTSIACLPQGVLGWNFITKSGQVSDDHGHGTSVAGIIASSLDTASKGNKYVCGSRFLILKVLDENGMGNLFDAICALDLSKKAGADVINVSWGFYGPDVSMMERIIKAASPGVVVTSLGNDTIHVDVAGIRDRHYPSEYDLRLDNVIAVAGDTRSQTWTPSSTPVEISGVSAFSNYTTSRQMITAASVDVIVWAPTSATPPNYQIRTGTSYAAAFVSAAVAINQCCKEPDLTLRSTLLTSGTFDGQQIHYQNIILQSTKLCDMEP